MARTVAVRGSELCHRVNVCFSQGGCQRALDIPFWKQLDTPNANAVGSKQIIDMPVTNVVVAASDPAMTLDTREPTGSERAAGVGIEPGFKNTRAERADHDLG